MKTALLSVQRKGDMGSPSATLAWLPEPSMTTAARPPAGAAVVQQREDHPEEGRQSLARDLHRPSYAARLVHSRTL